MVTSLIPVPKPQAGDSGRGAAGEGPSGASSAPLGPPQPPTRPRARLLRAPPACAGAVR